MPALPTTRDLLDRLARRIGEAEGYPNGVASDYRVAQLLGGGDKRATVSKWRAGKGGMGEDNALKFAELLELDPAYVLMCAQAERTHNLSVRAVWEKIAGSLAILLLVFAFSMPDAHASTGETTYPVYTLCARRLRRWILTFLLLPAFAGCALAPQAPDPVSAPFEAAAAAEITAWNARHATDLVAPAVLVLGTQPLDDGEDHCFRRYGRYYSCYLVISAALVASRPGYAMRDILPHEVAHDICVLTIPGCTADDHGPAWRAIARELGLPADDPYLLRPERVVSSMIRFVPR